MNEANRRMDDMIRGFREGAPASQPPDEPHPSATAEQVSAARGAGVPASWAHRLADRGEGLNADAQELGGYLRERGVEMLPAPDFGGGARETPPAAVPSMGSLVRGELQERRSRTVDYAFQLDRARLAALVDRPFPRPTNEKE